MITISSTIRIIPPIIQDVPKLPDPPKGFKWIRVLHDDESGWKDRHGAPETVDLMRGTDTVLNSKWQVLLFNKMREQVPTWSLDRLKKAWVSLTHDGLCYTDFSAAYDFHGNLIEGGRADYIMGVNLQNEGIGWKDLTTGGNIHLVKNEIIRAVGDTWYPIVTMNGSLSPMHAHYLTDEELASIGDYIWAVATNRSKVILADGRHKVDPFPQLDGADVPVLFISKKPNYIRVRLVKDITEWESPYIK